MAKEVLLYFPMYDFIAADAIAQIDENMGEEVTLRLNSPGGSIFAANGFHAKLKEHGNVHLKVDGAAMSACAFTPFYCKSSECLDVSRFVFHRADMYVSSQEDQTFLDGINKDLKAKMKARIDADKFKEITGKTIEELFDPETRIDIALTGKQAVAVGLIDKVTKLTPQLQKEISAFHKFYNVAAVADPSKQPTMITLESVKAEHPGVFAQIFELGKAASVADAIVKEKERVEAWLHFVDVDAKAVKEGVASGKVMTQLQIIELAEKKSSVKALAAIAADNAGDTPTDTPEAKAKEKEIADFVAGVKKNSTHLSDKK